MGEFETLKITSLDGKEMELKVITILKKPNDNKNFLLYTFDETAENIDIYASILKEEEGSYVLDSITEKEDWDLIQKAIEELAE
jgi:uncharacterized protein YrzB (UPF0473 family)